MGEADGAPGSRHGRDGRPKGGMGRQGEVGADDHGDPAIERQPRCAAKPPEPEHERADQQEQRRVEMVVVDADRLPGEEHKLERRAEQVDSED